MCLIGINDEELNEELAKEFNVSAPFGLSDFTYNNSRILNTMFEYLSTTSFRGVSVSLVRWCLRRKESMCFFFYAGTC